MEATPASLDLFYDSVKKHTMLSRRMACNTATASFLGGVSLTTLMSKHKSTITVTDFGSTSQVHRN
jgi:hypothetical protein